ncbi:hypothetical protein SD70_06330 [Gordoniibacillus kamchatkensis]|uniref:Uncharacterized protein n=1 Tax=Gordoniibacillus kamchatkensis TaxID=1590651 RepID=A0ABR5AKK3_9BACL|nr:hypothetical protein [Paenibacillus sp. VKM B-2647]KIL41496.1 hypothetical protein SD70_06330 [Paenibacillus sp. VKM B-2647]
MAHDEAGGQPEAKQDHELEGEPASRAPDASEIIFNWYQLIQNVLKEQFPDYEVDGQVGQHQLHGPMMAFVLQKEGNSYACGFFLSELVRQFQTNPNAVLWLTSFYVDLIRSPESKPLPNPPQSEDDAKELFDKHIVPHCAQTVREEFEPEPVYVDLELHPEHGPVLEAGFPSISDGNNTCAIPLHYLLTLYLMNRDPADSLVQALYQLKEMQEANA